ncbi:cytochrome b5-like heme/steroid binding domain-containing protein [Auriculariales sp. MPI-PUGE-AT-0066]|nr:cytochrome b5-like heme/steroid binding domain-containing protein [Auriculariales sp. MPI-PUGE-AT-0066]
MSRVVTYEEWKQHQTKDSFYVLLHNKVYDVSKFLDEHPGGDEIIMAEAGKDASDAFEDVGHSEEARSKLPSMLIGEFAGSEELKKTSHSPAATTTKKPASSTSSESTSPVVYAAAAAGVAVAYFAYQSLA